MITQAKCTWRSKRIRERKSLSFLTISRLNRVGSVEWEVKRWT